MNKLRLTIFVTILFQLSLIAQDNEEIKEFKPSGKAFAKVFTNAHLTSYDGEINYAFDLTRAYLGYGYKFTKNLSGKLNIDVGSPDVSIGDSLEGETSLQLTAYLKTAALSYKKRKLGVDFGLIGLKQFKTQETMWGHRYLYKSFQDAYKFGSSADLGLIVSYKIIDQLSADISILNGEGYKKLQTDSVFKYGVGVTGKVIDGLTLRIYYDRMGNNNAQSTIATFIGYATDKLNTGVEYNMQSNNKMKDGFDYSGLSVFGSYQASDLLEGFVRYDNLSSVTLSGANDAWNIKKDGQLIIAGIEISLAKGIKVAPNYQGWLPAASGAKSFSSLYINVEWKF